MSEREFARASIVELILLELHRVAPAAAEKELKHLDAIRRGLVAPADKRALIEQLWQAAGPTAILAAGRNIARATHDPIWRAAIRSASPQVLFDKWRKFEVYAHSTNRVVIAPVSETEAHFNRTSVSGTVPAPPENLMVCGLVLAMLEQIGCMNLRCEMTMAGGAAFPVLADGRLDLPADLAALDTGAWRVVWDWQSNPNHPTPDEVFPAMSLPLPPDLDPAQAGRVTAVADLLVEDITRQWTVAELARAAALSTRSLQRLLAHADLSFSTLVRRLRITAACQMLEAGEMPVTTIAFCAGFADSAHFSRDFRASMGMSPTQYRAAHG